jgi:hypothetical protein
MPFTLGQRVQTTVDTPSAYGNEDGMPAGSLGTVSRLPLGPGWGYGVLLDGDPDGLSASYDADELRPA